MGLVKLEVRRYGVYLESKDNILGYKYEFWVMYPMGGEVLKRVDTDKEDVCKYIEGNFNVKDCGTLQGKVVDNTLVTYLESNSCEANSVSEANKITSKITSEYHKFEAGYSSLIGNFSLLSRKLVTGLRRAGIEVPYEDEIRVSEQDCTVSIRFLGGMNSWSVPDGEDICDSECMDRKCFRKVKECVGRFIEENSVSVEVSSGEKAWTYFEFQPLGLKEKRK